MSVKILKKLSLTAFILFFVPSFLAAQEVKYLAEGSDKAIIILSTNTVSQMQAARQIIEKNGGKIENIFPPSVFIGEIPQNIAAGLRGLDIIQEVSYEKVDILKYESYEASVKDAVFLWNEKFATQIQGKRQAMPRLEDKKEPFRDDLIMPRGLPKSKEEKIRQNEAYQQHWQQRREEFLRQEQEKKNKRPKGQKTGKRASASALVYTQNSARLAAPESKTLTFGKASGAGYYDTSLYLAGDIAVGVFFVPGTKGYWTTQQMNDVFSSITQALDQFIADEPNAHISFTYIKEVDQTGASNPLPSSEGDYVNDLRNTYNTHWAYIIIVSNGDGRANANYFGPSLRLYSNDLRDGYAVRHETMHIFGATDQYGFSEQSPSDRWGYLNIVNANSLYGDGQGYFQGRGEGLADIMISGGPIGVYSRGQIGWRDSDGDGTLDPLDTFPDTVILSKTGSNPVTYTGKAQDKPLLCEWGDYGSVTFNTIKSVEYRINHGAWCEATPSAGAYTSATEEFSFTNPSLANGEYTIEIRAINSVNNAETSYVKDTLYITGSSVTNVRPFPVFSITPPKGSIETNFSFDANSSSDIEDDVSNLYARWDFENDGVFDTVFSQNKFVTHKYTAPGLKTAKLEVRDRLGLTNTVTKQIEVAATNLSPQALFTVTPESQHSDSRTFTVKLNAQGSYDGEDALSDLKFRWDFEDDGIWDTDYLDNYAFEHSYQLPVSYVYDTPDDASNVFVADNYAYIADGSSGLQIIDISSPSSPKLAGSHDTPGYAYYVYISGNYAYIADGSSGLQIIDISSSSSPKLAGSYDKLSSAVGVYVSGNYAYVADFYSGLQIIDITTPSSPKLAGSYDTPGEARSVYVSGHYAFVADGLSGLQIIDITTPSSPKLAGSYATNSATSDVFVTGNYAYVADYESGLQIIDIASPSSPKLAGNYGTPDAARNVYVLGDYAYVADRYAGLCIFDLSKDNNKAADSASRHWRVKLEAKDKNGNISQATRDVWDVTYNHPPTIEGIEKTDRYLDIKLTGEYSSGQDIIHDIYVVGNYAYVASLYGLTIIDIANPSRPQLLGQYSSWEGSYYDVYVYGNYAYVAGYKGLQIIDVANPLNPKLVGSYNVQMSVYSSGIGVCVSGNYAYLADNTSGLQIIDITNPSNPKLTGRYSPLHGAKSVYVYGNYAYVIWSKGLEIIDISNALIPKYAGSYYSRYIDDYNSVYVYGNYVYAAGYKGLQIIDITSPSSPKLTGSYDTPETASGVYILGSYAYVANGNLGLQIIDITSPSSPKYAGDYDTPGYAVSVSVLGSYAYIADDKGISILQLKTGEALRSMGGFDSDQNTLWDGLLEYRWDFDNDEIWDTKFSDESDYFLSDNKYSNIVCEIRDRFGATSRVSFTPKDTISPTTVVSGIDGLWHNDTVTVTLDASDEESGIDKTFYSTDGSAPSIAYTAPFTLSNEGNYIIKYYSIDKAGNKEEINNKQVIIDKTPPQARILINDGALDTTFTPVTLNLLAYDALSGVSQMRFSNDGIAYSEPEPYGSNSRVIKPWVLTTGAGNKTVYVQVQDGAGNWSQPVSDTIFKNPSFLYGDINGDGFVASGDALFALKASLGLVTLTPEQARAADVDGSGTITAGDALLILQYSVGRFKAFPVENKLFSRQPLRRYLQNNRNK